MTSFTPEQLRQLARYAQAGRQRPWNMRGVSPHDWEDLLNDTLLACYECGAPVRGRDELPKSAGDLDPLEHFWLQRLKNEFERWLRHQKAKARPTVDSTLDSLLPGSAEGNLLLQLEGEESVRDRAKLTPRQRRATLAKVNPTFERVRRTTAPNYDGKSNDGEVRSGIDRALHDLTAEPRERKCCKGGCWRCKWYAGRKRPASYRPPPLVLDPEMQTVIDAIDNRKASIAESADRLEKCPHGIKAKKVRHRRRATVKTPKHAARIVTRRPGERTEAAA